jgi:hypothetical protein
VMGKKVWHLTEKGIAMAWLMAPALEKFGKIQLKAREWRPDV